MRKSITLSVLYSLVFYFLFSINTLIPESNHMFFGIAVILEYLLLIYFSYRFNPKALCFLISYVLIMLIFFSKHLANTNPSQVNGVSIFDTFSIFTIIFSIAFILSPLAIGKFIVICKTHLCKSNCAD